MAAVALAQAGRQSERIEGMVGNGGYGAPLRAHMRRCRMLRQGQAPETPAPFPWHEMLKEKPHGVKGFASPKQKRAALDTVRLLPNTYQLSGKGGPRSARPNTAKTT